MKERFNIPERMAILALLPQESNFLTLKIVMDLQKELSISEQEHTDWEIKEDRDLGMLFWNTEVDTTKEIEFGDKAKSIVVEALKKLDEADPPKLTMNHVSIYEKFIGE